MAKVNIDLKSSIIGFANCAQLPRLAPLVRANPALKPPYLLRRIGVRCLSRMDHPPRSTTFTMRPLHPSVSAQQAARRANGNHCPPLSLHPSRRTTHSASATAMMRKKLRKLRLRSKPLARKANRSSMLLSSQCPTKWVPRARRPRARPSLTSQNNCE